jgi:hypothetical protein
MFWKLQQHRESKSRLHLDTIVTARLDRTNAPLKFVQVASVLLQACGGGRKISRKYAEMSKLTSLMTSAITFADFLRWKFLKSFLTCPRKYLNRHASQNYELYPCIHSIENSKRIMYSWKIMPMPH